MKAEKENILKAYEAASEKGKEMIKGIWPDAFPEGKTYKRGDRFKHDNGDIAMLCRLDNGTSALICLEMSNGSYAGNIWAPAVSVSDSMNISEKEFREMCGRSFGSFTLIED